MNPCQAEPDLFFSTKHADIREAIQACRTCPALDACRKVTEAANPDHGVWAGQLYGQRSPSPEGGCPECGRHKPARTTDGLCSTCYNRAVREGRRATVNRQGQTWEAYKSLKAQGVSRQVAADLLGVSAKSLYEKERRLRLKGVAA
jgi:hypothetical protein